MDPCSFNINSANELRLRRHIREVLLPYARNHLTSDHVVFTERAVEELLLQTLEHVPMADARSFHPPTEPFEVLVGFLDSLDLTPPEERWVTSSTHVKYLRTFFPPPVDLLDLQTERCWHDEDCYVRLSLICRPTCSPILSKRARRDTPKLGSTNYRASIPRTSSTLTAFLGLNSLPVQSMEDLPTPPVDDVLYALLASADVSRGIYGWPPSLCRDLRLKLESATSARVRPFIQSALVPSMAEKLVDCFERTPNVPEFLSHESPPRCLPSLDSPPLFPRVAQEFSTHNGIRGTTKTGLSNTTRVPDLIPMLQVASPEFIDGEDGDINNHHMEVASGWTTLKFSSPPPPSPHSSNGSSVDELWNISPPGTPATSLVTAKMDEVEIPRLRKFGHRCTLTDEGPDHGGTTNLLTAAKSPGFFITSFISAPIPMAQAHKPITSQLGVKSDMHLPHPLLPCQNTPSSLFGHLPSLFEHQAKEASAGIIRDLQEQRFDDAVASIYVSTPQDPLSYIMEEKLVDKDMMLMDVPNMPPPTAHPREPIFFPEGMRTFVTPTELERLDTARHKSPLAFLRPVKGIKPLALDLSWRPFNFGKTIPTDEEVAGIAKSVQPKDEVPGYCDEKCEKAVGDLLDLGTPLISAEEAHLILTPNVPRGCEEFGTSPMPERPEESGCIGYLLTQRERLRASGAQITRDAEIEVQVQDDTDSGQRVARSHGENILTQDENFCQHGLHWRPRNSFDLAECRSGSRALAFDDSGIDIMDNDIGRYSTGESSAPHHLLRPPQDDLLYGDTPKVKENADNERGDQESVPPWYADDYQQVDCERDPQHNWSCYFEFPASDSPSFEPLSFASQNQPPGPSHEFAHPKVQNAPPSIPSDRHVGRPEDDPVLMWEHEETNSRATKRRKLDDLVPASSKDLFSTFIGLRNQGTLSRTIERSETRNDTPTHQTPDVPEQILPRAAPDDVFDQHTVRLPDHWVPAAKVHRYLVSMSLIQKRALVRELQSYLCRIDLVEGHDLGGTDIVIDPDYGVLFVPLFALPANIESAVERISGESWRYLSLLIIFEAFPAARSYRADHLQGSRPIPYAYTPPVCKAIKKLRRNLGIAEGCGTMNPSCTVSWAFANDVEEAAKFVRCFGEEACAISTERGYGLLWDERDWLEEDEREGEADLARVQGMNAFSAFVMLYDRSLEGILDLSPEARLAEFGPLLGQGRMIGLNAVIENRLWQGSPVIVDSVVDPGY